MKLYALAFVAFAAVFSTEAAKPALHPLMAAIPSSHRAKKQETLENLFPFTICPYPATATELADFYAQSDVVNCLADINTKLAECDDADSADDLDDCSIREYVEVACDNPCSNAGDEYLQLCYKSLTDAEFEAVLLEASYIESAECGRGPNGEQCAYISANLEVLANATINCPAPTQDTPLECPADCKTSVQQGKEIFGCCLNNYLGDFDRAAAFGESNYTYLASDELFTACGEGVNDLGECLAAAWAQSSVAILGAVVIAVMTSLMA